MKIIIWGDCFFMVSIIVLCYTLTRAINPDQKLIWEINEVFKNIFTLSNSHWYFPHCDLAIVSIYHQGASGNLNTQVLKEYGYTDEELPDIGQLQHEFCAIPPNKGKAIIFIVTVTSFADTATSLQKKLYNALSEYRGWFHRKIFDSLDGAGGLSLEKSYSITAKAINDFHQKFPSTEVNFIVSVPNGKQGMELIETLIKETPINNNGIEKLLDNFKCQYFLAGSKG